MLFQQLVMAATENASEALEAMLPRQQQTCPVHTQTTVGASNRCDMCDLDEASQPRTWAERASRGQLPAKDYTSEWTF